MMKKICLAVSILLLSLSACSDKRDKAVVEKNDASTLFVLAGSELKDVEPVLPQVEQATGIKIRMRYAGTLDAVEQLQGTGAPDVAWLASNRYAMLIPEVKRLILASDKTMLTPVVLGVKESKARELGWVNNPNITWKDIAEAAGRGKFTFGMTNPSTSNTGFSGLLGLAAALSGKGDALEEADIDTVSLSAFFKAQRLTSGSSGWLIDAYLNDQDKADGLVNYASSLELLNRNPRLRERLVLIYPKDGILTSDYPIMLINGAKREAYAKVVDYLRGYAFQSAMTAATLRRPVNPDVAPALGMKQTLAELPFPARLAVVDAVLVAFDNQLRLPTDASFVLDVSGSMAGARIASLKQSMIGLAGGDASISGRFARFHERERVFIMPFNTYAETAQRFDLGSNATANSGTLHAIADRVNGLTAAGGTALFESTQKAYLEAAARRRAEPGRFYSIVVMTDGISNAGIDMAQFSAWYRSLPAADQGIRIFPILFGEGDSAQLQALATLSGGKLFDATKTGLPAIFKDIRGYQ
jgi:Ca-activated chloride channel family protein